MMTPTWYDLLDVEPTASTDEIRAAWKAAVADLDPTDRRFRTLSEAASVLLDEKKRAAYDGELATREAEAADTAEPEESDGSDAAESLATSTEPVAAEDDAPGGDATQASADEPAGDTADRGETRQAGVRSAPPFWVLAAVGVVAVAAAVAAVIVLVSGGSSETKVITADNKNTTTSTLDGSYGKPLTHDHVTLVEEHAAAALQAAKAAVVPILSYDYRHLAKDEQRAHAYMTSSYRKKSYDPLFAEIKNNAPHLKTVVTTNPPVDAGIVRVSKDRVQVLVFVDRPTTNAKTSKPIAYQNYVTLTMVDEGGRWLVDNMETSAAGE